MGTVEPNSSEFKRAPEPRDGPLVRPQIRIHRRAWAVLGSFGSSKSPNVTDANRWIGHGDDEVCGAGAGAPCG